MFDGLEQQPRWAIYFALMLAQLIFAASYVVFTVGLEHFDTPIFALLRLGTALGVVFPLAWCQDRYVPRWRDVPSLALLGALGPAAVQGLLLAGIRATNPFNAAVVQPLQPVLTAALCILANMEPAGFMQLLGIGVSAVGCCFILYDEPMPGENLWQGSACLFLMCLCFAAFLILQKPLLETIPVFTLNAWVLVFGLLPVLVWCWLETPLAPFSQLRRAPLEAWGAVLYGGLLTAGVAPVLLSYGIQHSSVGMAAGLVPLQPMFSCILSAYTLGFYPSNGQLIGGAAITCGMLFVLWGQIKQVGMDEESHLLNSSLLSLIPPGSALSAPNRSRGPSWYSEWSESRIRASSILSSQGPLSQTELPQLQKRLTDPSPLSQYSPHSASATPYAAQTGRP